MTQKLPYHLARGVSRPATHRNAKYALKNHERAEAFWLERLLTDNYFLIPFEIGSGCQTTDSPARTRSTWLSCNSLYIFNSIHNSSKNDNESRPSKVI